MNRREEQEARARKQLLRRARYYTIAFLAAGIAIAIGGAAILAWMLTNVGQPFVRSWLIISVIVILPGLIALLWKTMRGR